MVQILEVAVLIKCRLRRSIAKSPQTKLRRQIKAQLGCKVNLGDLHCHSSSNNCLHSNKAKVRSNLKA